MPDITSLLQKNISLADKNWFRTGGAAEVFAAPKSAHDFYQLLSYAHTHSIPVTLIGEGANILIHDDGIKGLVIRPSLTDIEFYDNSGEFPSDIYVTAQAGASIQELIVRCLDAGALGLEEFSGIPGTVGGSVFINIHYFQFLLSAFLVKATLIDALTGMIVEVNNDWFNFGYNYSRLHEKTHYLIDATFKVKRADTPLDSAYAQGRRTEIIRHRTARYPHKGTCGSFFRNFHADEVTLESNGKKLIYVAYYLDKIGIKGALSCGGAHVSYQHANMLVNDGTATSNDIVTLARTMQQKVYDAYGIIPQPECQLLGFKTYPFL